MNGRNPESHAVTSKEQLADEWLRKFGDSQLTGTTKLAVRQFAQWLDKRPAPEPPQPGAKEPQLAAAIEALRPDTPVPAIAGDAWDAGYETAIDDVLAVLRAHGTPVVRQEIEEANASLRKYVHEQIGFLTDDDNRPAEALLRMAAEKLRPVAETPAPPREPDWKCDHCGRDNDSAETHCVHCEWSHKHTIAGVLHERACQGAPCRCGAVPAEKASVCTTCNGTGEVDETLGGIHTLNPHAPCPDCNGQNGEGKP